MGELKIQAGRLIAIVTMLIRILVWLYTGTGTFTKARFDTAKDELSKRKCDTPATGRIKLVKIYSFIYHPLV